MIDKRPINQRTDAELVLQVLGTKGRPDPLLVEMARRLEARMSAGGTQEAGGMKMPIEDALQLIVDALVERMQETEAEVRALRERVARIEGAQRSRSWRRQAG